MKINKSTKVILTTFLIIWIMTGFSAFHIAKIHAEENSNNVYEYLRLFNEVYSKLNNYYVDPVDNSKLMIGAIKGMLGELDPHTNFFTKEQFKEFTTETKGEFGGLGITIDKQGDYITVVSPIEGTPAYKMGILSGDKIVKVDGKNVVGMPTSDTIKLMRGKKGTHVVITIKRPGVKKLLDFDIIRDTIIIKSIPYAFKMDNDIGYIRIRQFSANTTTELRAKLDELEKQGIKGLLIDLRFNPGGLLSEAVDTVNEFIGKDKRVVFTKGRIPQANRDYLTKYDRMRSGYPVIVLINQATASAAEIFSGSLQDYDKGLVVGMPSFGKGSVQQLFPLSGGRGIKITTAHYYINSGRCIHKYINDKILRGKEVTKAEKEKIEKENKSHIFKTSKGRIVYGGGGITPDIKIPQEKMNNFEIEISRKNLFFEYSVDYHLNHKDYGKDFVASKKVVNDFLELAKKDSVTFTQATVDSSYNWLQNRIEANVIGRKFGELDSYEKSIQIDSQLQKAVSIFSKCKNLDEMFKYAKEVSKKENGKK